VAFDRKRQAAAAEELLAPHVDARRLASPLPLELSVKSTLAAVLKDLATLRKVDAGVVHCHFSHDHVLARMALPRSVRLVRSIHAPRSLRWSLPRADAYTVPTEELAAALLGRRVAVLPPLVDAQFRPAEQRTELRQRLGLGAGPLVGMVSTFQRSRRHELGVRAFAALLQRVPDATLVLSGDGARKDAVRALVGELGLGERVRFVGYQKGADFVALLQALDEVWLLGLGNDWAARGAAQARACGVRVVAVDEGGLARFADAVVRPELRELAAAALGTARSAVRLESNESIARRVLELYEGAR
jgi:glycosyltransferase involved in cell wall biosynthesis